MKCQLSGVVCNIATNGLGIYEEWVLKAQMLNVPQKINKTPNVQLMHVCPFFINTLLAVRSFSVGCKIKILTNKNIKNVKRISTKNQVN